MQESRSNTPRGEQRPLLKVRVSMNTRYTLSDIEVRSVSFQLYGAKTMVDQFRAERSLDRILERLLITRATLFTPYNLRRGNIDIQYGDREDL